MQRSRIVKLAGGTSFPVRLVLKSIKKIELSAVIADQCGSSGWGSKTW